MAMQVKLLGNRFGLLLLCLIGLSPAEASAGADGASRDLPGCYVPDVQFTITIAIEPPAGTLAIGLEDSPPLGWAVKNISNGGNYDADNNKVKWGPFFEPFPSEVTYDITPAEDAEGEHCFAGTISFDGINESIGGDECVNESCDDGDPCTEDACVEGECVHTPECSEDADCDDNDPCTVDSCVDGCCEHAPECTVDADCSEDGDPCTIAECIEGCCVHIPECEEDSDCDDIDACTTDSCIDGCCAHDSVDCDDGNECTNDSCDPKTGCVHDPIGNCCTEDVHCDDELFCNGQETCQEGQCVPGTPVDCTIEDAHCLVGVCNEDTDQCDVEPLPDGTECTDHDPCTENDICIEGNCMGQPIDCDDGDPCTIDHCDFDTGECVHEPIGECCADADCHDGIDCTVDTCVDGTCVHTPDHEFCDDEDKCTEDICDPTEGCMNLSVPDDDCCDDDEDCEDKEICVDNHCRRTCENDNDCNDENDCTDDECIDEGPEQGLCEYSNEPDGMACEDGFYCTINDTCESGVCISGDLNPECKGDTGNTGGSGPPGEDGISCWDLDGDGIGDPDEDINEDGDFNAEDCQGPPGPPGEPGLPGPAGEDGLSCWDLDGDGVADPAEDINGDGNFDALDCQGSGESCWDLNGNGHCDLGLEDRNNDGECDALDCQPQPGAEIGDWGRACTDELPCPQGLDCVGGNVDIGITGNCLQACEDDTECDDQLVCNGQEICQAGFCVAGDSPCEEEEVCVEDAGFFLCLAETGCVTQTGPDVCGACGDCGEGALPACLMMILALSFLKTKKAWRRRRSQVGG